jgi:23S rRNA (adenine2503-C2)-methyltransferase
LIFFEYVLLKGINDGPKDAYNLLEKLNRIPCKLNVIPYNETDTKFGRPEEEHIKKFVSYFKEASFPVTLRYSGGRGIKAACGQLYHENLKK